METLEHLSDLEKKAVREIKEKVTALAGNRLRGIYLFGSKARGDYDPESDVDLAIIIEDLDRSMKRKVIDIVVEIETEYVVVISSLVMSWKDFLDLKERERRIALDIEREGIGI